MGVQKKVALALTVFVLLFVWGLAEKIKLRFILKSVENCGDSGLTITASDVKITYKNKGKVAVVKNKVIVSEDTEIAKFEIVLYKGGNPPQILTSLTGSNFCKELDAGNNKFIEPLFASGELPKGCTFKKGDYPNTMVFDFVTEAESSSKDITGRYNFNYTYSATDQQKMCITGYGDVKKEK